METPTRPRSRRLGGNKLRSKVASTPKATKKPSQDDSDEPESPIMPCSQALHNPTGVYWNYEGSPGAKARLKEALNRTYGDEEEQRASPPPESLTPAIKMKFRKNRKKKEEPPPKFDHCEFDYLADLQRLNDELNNQRNAKTQSKSVPFDKEISNGPLSSVISTPPDASGKRQTNSSSISTATASSNHNKTPSGSKIQSSASRDMEGSFFDSSSVDNSFLIMCTQAAEKQHFKAEPPPPPTVAKKSTKAPTPSTTSDFDQDDDFDMLLSQMEATPPTNRTVSKLSESSWRRVHSSPEARTTSAGLLPTNCKVKQRHQTESSIKAPLSSFNKEEAERKKREAIERRRKRIEATGSGGSSQPNSQASQPVSVGTQSNGVLAAKPPPQTLVKPAPSQFQFNKEEAEKRRREAKKRLEEKKAAAAASRDDTRFKPVVQAVVFNKEVAERRKREAMERRAKKRLNEGKGH